MRLPIPRTLRGWMIVIAVVSLPMAVVGWYLRLDAERQTEMIMLGHPILFLSPLIFLYYLHVVGRYYLYVVGRNRYKRKGR